MCLYRVADDDCAVLPSGSMIFKREQIKAEPLAPEVQNELEQLEERKKAKDKCVAVASSFVFVPHSNGFVSAMEVTTHKLQKLKKKLHKIEEEKKELSKTSEDLRATLTEERAAVHDLSHLTEKLTTEMTTLENERRKLQVELQTMKAECVLVHGDYFFFFLGDIVLRSHCLIELTVTIG